MSITKLDIDKWIEAEGTKLYGNSPLIYKKIYIQGAQLLAPLLLQAVEAFHRIHYNNYRGVDQSVELRQVAGEYLSKIEAAVKGGAK